jgi:hypothetical protein
MFEQFRAWLSKNRRFLFSRYTTDARETQEPERTLTKLPTEIRRKLVDRVENLASNPGDCEAIVEKLNETFELWRDSSEGAINSFVVLNSPITAVSRILTETLEDWAEQKQIPVRLLALKARPEIADTIKPKLKQYLEEEFVKDAIGSHQPEVVAIPNLSWCFLRSLEGLEGIEYLQSRLCDGFKDRFWIIGGGQVGWQYLNSVSNIEAYCGEVLNLPPLSAEQLQEWLEPIVKELNINFDDPSIDKTILKDDKDSKTYYFERLSDVSEGVSTVAIQVFLKSIHYQESERENAVVAKVPELPELPELEPADRYLLYSLLLHGDLTISALVESLGDTAAEVQARVQILRHQGVIEQRQKVLKINPIYYSKIKQNLADNNFVIDKH